MRSRSMRYQSRGVALLMSLSVILLLSIALMKTFEKRSLEVAQLGQNLDRFQAENLSRSGLKLILFSIKKAGLVTVNGYLEQLKEIEFPIGNGTMKIREITPVDYRFNLNTKIKSDTDPRIAVFNNIIAFAKEEANEYNYLSAGNANEALSAVIDWTDKDEQMDSIFLIDSEQYPREEPEYSVKNREFDRLTEVRLLPAFRELGFSRAFLGQHFRVTEPSGEDWEEFVDINLTPEATINQFLNGYDIQDEKYKNVFDRKEDILRIITDGRSHITISESADFTEVPIPFPPNKLKQTFWKNLEIEGIELTSDEKELFKSYSNHLFIHYQVFVGRVTLNVQSMVQVDYTDLNKNLDIKELTILWLRIV